MFGEIVFDGKLILTGIYVVDCFKFIGGRVLKLGLVESLAVVTSDTDS